MTTSNNPFPVNSTNMIPATVPAGTNKPATWRDFGDNLTPAQVRHLAADERLATDALRSDEAHARATAQEMLDMLPDEAKFYAEHNAPVGLETPSMIEMFRTLLHRTGPTDLNRTDVAAMLDLLGQWSGWREPK